MRELVRQGEHLRRLGVRAVDEDQRRERVAEREAAELGGVEAAVGVAHHHPADHDEHACSIGLADEEAERVRPCRTRTAGRQIEAERLAHPGRDGLRRRLDRGAADEPDFGLLRDPREVAIPALPFLAGIDRIQEVRARLPHGPPGEGAEVRDGHGFLGRAR